MTIPVHDPFVFGTHAPLRTFTPLPGITGADSPLSAWVSEDVEDEGWDEFLGSIPLGQFQQSALWAAGKCDAAWRVLRVILRHGDRALGGFQVLYRITRLGGIGYISKGPVLVSEAERAWTDCLTVIRELVRQRGWRALIIQPPDLSQVTAEWLMRQRFHAEHVMRVIDSSLWFPLQGTPDTLMKRMPSYTRTFIRQAIRKGVTVRDAEEGDIPLFFELMLRTCERQGVSVNPATEDAFRRIWRAFHNHQAMRIAFAEHEGRVLAGLAYIAFGDRVTLWKKGWTAESANLRPNHLLYFDALCWAQRKGFKFCDFYSVSRGIAETLLRGEKLSEAQARSRDRFHVGFGARPVLLPPSLIYVASPVLGWLYRIAAQPTTRVLRLLSTRRRG